MKALMARLSAIALLAVCGIGPSQGFTSHNNSVLHGCYAILSRSVDTEPATRNRDMVGTLCFDGTSLIQGYSFPNRWSGGWVKTNGAPAVSHGNVTGHYFINDIPADGMGKMQFTGGCGTHAISVYSVVGGLAGGFYFSYIAGTCGSPHPFVIDGEGIYQGP